MNVKNNYRLIVLKMNLDTSVGTCNKQFRPLYGIKGQNLNSPREGVEDNP